MGTLNDYINSLEDLSNNLNKHIEEITLKNSGKLLSTLKLRLFSKGLDGNLNFLGPYSPQTIKRKQDKGQPAAHTTLKDTGEFYDGMFVNFKNNEIIIDSTDDKTSELEFLYGIAILELTTNELENFIDSIIEPELQKKLDNFGNINIEL